MTEDSSSGKWKTRWTKLWRHPHSKWLLGIPLGAWLAVAVGATGMVGFEISMHMTGTVEFCTEACHSMEAYTAPEWRDSPHYSNASGVVTGCGDCHIPKVYPQKLWAKAYDGGRHVIGELFFGTLSTQEKYDQRRLHMAEYVWKAMEGNDSRECRNCHKDAAFDVSLQEERAARAHERGPKEGQTCISCHKGIAHRTPEEVDEENGVAMLEHDK